MHSVYPLFGVIILFLHSTKIILTFNVFVLLLEPQPNHSLIHLRQYWE
jgi:hypothetical protein